jgi:hypothetical protein
MKDDLLGICHQCWVPEKAVIMPVISDYIFQSLRGLRSKICRFSFDKSDGVFE